MLLQSKLGIEDGGQLLVRVGGWSDKTKVILNSTPFKFKMVEVEVELGKKQVKRVDNIWANSEDRLEKKQEQEIIKEKKCINDSQCQWTKKQMANA